MLGAAAVAYVFTVIAGIPAAQNARTDWAVQEYKQIHSQSGRMQSASHPRIKTFVSVPVLPFVIVSYHEYQLAGLYGWGGWDVQVWYIFGAQSIGRFGLWIS